MNRRIAIGLTAVTALLATACDSTGEAAVSSSVPTTASGDVRTVLPTWISGLRVVRTSGGTACRWTTSYPSVPGAKALTEAVRRGVEARRRSFATGCGSGGAGDSRLNVSFDFLVAAGDVIGVQTTAQDETAAADGMTLATYWYDGRSGKAVPALGMIAEGSADRFAELVEQALMHRKGADPHAAHAALDDPAARVETLNNLAFAENGSLVATFDQGTVAPVPAGRQEVVLSQAEVTPLLSGFGRRVQRQALHPGHSLTLRSQK
ncbi:MAG: peptidoglycan-N-acetylglucosamine deacetylase [Streptomyces sp.]|nr:peptidoglycan-N-acetylglucosamine deacetylase [Streptomyces sp.]